jgi:hypothetical protein
MPTPGENLEIIVERSRFLSSQFSFVRSNPAWGMNVCTLCVLSGIGFFVWLITRPEEYYRMWDVQSVWTRSPIRGGHNPEWGWSATEKKRWDRELPVVLRPIQTGKYKMWAEYRIFERWTWRYVFLTLDFKPLIHGRLFMCCSPSNLQLAPTGTSASADRER